MKTIYSIEPKVKPISHPTVTLPITLREANQMDHTKALKKTVTLINAKLKKADDETNLDEPAYSLFITVYPPITLARKMIQRALDNHFPNIKYSYTPRKYSEELDTANFFLTSPNPLCE
jgi:hypothetical protein